MKRRGGVDAMVATHVPMFPAIDARRPWDTPSGHPIPTEPHARVVPAYWLAAAAFGVLAWSILFGMI